ncbi:MAG: sigma-70 family RNA polymerase sigma factor [Chitinophagales bacterium]|nr:sigma-70 family RNA polymerase sigma factor [Chitinophagales bacterium]MBP6153330.1 sigma-70 family RNA polymerase sigma factor [Chitinophagales bacterium]
MDAILNIKMNEIQTKNTVSQTINMMRKQLFAFIKNKVNIVEDAEDILQEVWYQFSNFSNIDELDNASAWLYAVSRNKIIDFYRKKKTDNLEDYTYENEEGDFSIKDTLLIDDSNNPELAMFKDLFWDELIKALDELPKNQRFVFIENEIEDKTLQKIADETGENLKTIISRKGYATKHLKKRLQHLYNELKY